MPRKIEILSCHLQLTNKDLHEPLQRQMMQFYDVGLFRVIDRVFQKFSQYNWEFEEIELELPSIAFHEFGSQYLIEVERELTKYLERYLKEVSSKERQETRKEKRDLSTVIDNDRSSAFSQQLPVASFRENLSVEDEGLISELLDELGVNTADNVKEETLQYSPTDLVLYFLSQGSFPLNGQDISEQQLDLWLSELFASKQSSQWQQIYRAFRHQGQPMDAAVLENYLAQNPERISYLIQLDGWVPLQKKEMTSLKRGMRRQQNRQSNYAKDVTEQLTEPQITKVVGYIEPQHQETVLYFVEQSVAVAKEQSLTDKLTEFKKVMYAFVISYLLLKEGYSFQKKQFVEYQIRQMAHHFGIRYEQMLQLFLETLSADASFDQEKELYLIIQLLQSGSSIAQEEDPLETEEVKEVTSPYKLTPEVWSKLFMYYLKHQKFPKEVSIPSFSELLQSIPIPVMTQERLQLFLESQAAVKQFLKEISQKGNEITIEKLVSMINDQLSVISQQSSVSSLQSSMNNDQSNAEIWTEIFVHYLTYGSFPNWTSISAIQSLIKAIPLSKVTSEKLSSFLKVQPILHRFLGSSKAIQEDIILDDLIAMILTGSSAIEPIAQQRKEAHWIKVFVFYLTYKKFPTWTSFQNVEQLLTSIPIDKKSKTYIKLFLSKQTLIQQFLQSTKTSSAGAQIDDLVLMIQGRSMSLKGHETEAQKSHWIRVFVRYLQAGELPSWTLILNVKTLFDSIPVDAKNPRKIEKFFLSKKEIRQFLVSSTAKQHDLTLDDLLFLITAQKQDNSKEILTKQTAHWVKVLMYYFEYHQFPHWSAIQSLSMLQQQMPRSFNETKTLKTQPRIAEFLRSTKAKSDGLQVDDLIVLLQKENVALTGGQRKKNWIKVWVYFLTHHRFPSWSRMQTVQAFIQQNPFENSSEKELHEVFQSEAFIQQFLRSDKAKQQGISIDHLVAFIQQQSSSELYQSLTKKYSQKVQDKASDEITPSQRWVTVFLFVLKYQKLPWWSNFISIASFLEHIQVESTDVKEIIHFLQKNKKSSSVWRMVQSLSIDESFRKILIAWFVPNTNHQATITKIATLFSPLTSQQKQAFAEHFGMFPNGALFWQTLWESRSVLFSPSPEAVLKFWNRLPKQFDLQEAEFQQLTTTWISEVIQDEALKKLIAKQYPIAQTHQRELLSERFLKLMLFHPSYRVTQKEWLQFKKAFRSRPLEMITVLEAIINEKQFTSNELTNYYQQWIARLFPEKQQKMSSLFHELVSLEKRLFYFTQSDLTWAALFLWKAASRFRFRNVNTYFESLFLAYSKRKRSSFSDLLVQWMGIVKKYQKDFPELYKSLTFLKLKHRIVMEDDFQEMLVEEESRDQSKQEEEADLLVELPYAGLVLLWPFVSMLLQRLELWDAEKKEFVSTSAQNKGVYLLYFLATGTDVCEESSELLLMKLLLGLPRDFESESVVLTPEEKQLCESLITAAITQWKRLGTISIDGFRTTFLHRAGTLEEEEEAYHIRIESLSLDILLDFLPWTISTIRLPWLEKTMTVTWREKSLF